MFTKFFLNFAYSAHIKFSSMLYRFIKYLSLKNPNYIKLLDDLSIYSKELINNGDYVTPFNYEILKYIPKKYLNVLVYTENVKTDIHFLMRLYKTIINVPEFIVMGEVKILLICTYGEDMFTLSTSLPITSKTTPQEFIGHFFKSFISLTLKGYPVNSFDVLLVKSITGDKPVSITHPSNNLSNQKRSYSTKARSITVSDPSLIDHDDFIADGYGQNKDPRRFILPLKAKENRMTKIAVFDIETFVYEGKLYPYAIGLQYKKYNKIRKIIYYYENTHDSVEENSALLLERMVNYMVENCKHYAVFAHNLGKFDGILMMSSLFKVLGPHSIIIGKDNSIITISFKNIKLLDSLKIFPMSLKQLAIQFKVDTQKGELDHTKINIDNVTNDDIKLEVLKYLEADISSLYECMEKASDYIFNKCKVNISDVYSASSLAMKHFRTSYLSKEGIPLIPRHMSEPISEAYYGGISQVYKSYGRNLYYYDINSLYPWAMTQEMPYEYLGISYNPKLKNTFGFIYASIYVPSGLKYKPLPIRLDEVLATPSGHILGVYFSEELKYAESLGCIINVHKAYIFSKKYLFNKYVEDVYAEKAVAKGSDRVFVKLLLNGLYGFFARTEDKYVALFLPLDKAIEQAQIYPVYNLIVMDDDETALLIRDVRASKDHCEATNNKYLDHLDINNTTRTKSNRAIAAAITAYSRIRIHQFKDICGDVYYSDTDSIVTGNKLDDKYVNNLLGMMKDEFKGVLITEGIFLSPKLYGLRLADGTEVIKARGVPGGLLDFDALMRVYKGETIEFNRTLLFKSLHFQSIFEKDIAGRVEHKVPSGKIPIYDDNNLIIEYKDMHRNILSAIKDNSFKYRISSRVSNMIRKIKEKLSH